MGPRLFQTVIVQTRTVNAGGDRVLASGVAYSGAVWSRRRKSVLAGQGEELDVNAQGFLQPDAVIKNGDQLTISDTDQRYDVVTVISGYDDRGVLDHIGVELTSI